jgi:hypothetical protein
VRCASLFSTFAKRSALWTFYLCMQAGTRLDGVALHEDFAVTQ